MGGYLGGFGRQIVRSGWSVGSDSVNRFLSMSGGFLVCCGRFDFAKEAQPTALARAPAKAKSKP